VTADRDPAAEDLRALHQLAVAWVRREMPASGPAEAMPAAAFRISDIGTVAEEVGGPGERGADPLYATLFVVAAEGRLRAAAVVTGITIRDERTGVEHPAAAVDLEHRDADPVTIYLRLDRGGDEPRVVQTIPCDGRAMVFPARGGEV
jgi:hypothetical protein